MTVKEDKSILRKVMLEKRKGIDAVSKQAYDNWICSELEKLIIMRNVRLLHAYLPISTEINITPLLQKLLSLDITIVCPKTLPKHKLENRILRSFDDLETGVMGTKHPAKPEVYEGPFDLVIVPGLAFDNTKHRLGYGGGYYDNFLKTQPDAYKAGIFYPFQQISHVPVESHDIGLDLILSRDL